MQKKWAVESMCDNGAEVEELKANGRSPLLYSAINGFDEVCMYLCLRVKDVDVEDE
jgi:ankyrin repeat protein